MCSLVNCELRLNEYSLNIFLQFQVKEQYFPALKALLTQSYKVCYLPLRT